MSRHLQQKFCYISSRQCLDNIFSPILKNSGKKLIFLKNNCFRVSHMGCEARFLSLMVFLSFPQLNFIFRASILNCTAAFFARFRYFQKGCSFSQKDQLFYFQSKALIKALNPPQKRPFWGLVFAIKTFQFLRYDHNSKYEKHQNQVLDRSVILQHLVNINTF